MSDLNQPIRWLHISVFAAHDPVRGRRFCDFVLLGSSGETIKRRKAFHEFEKPDDVAAVSGLVRQSGKLFGPSGFLQQQGFLSFVDGVLHDQALMAADGQPYLIALLVPGDAALASCNRYGMLTDDFPNRVPDLFRVWSYQLDLPGYRAPRLKFDCGLVFSDTVASSWIDRVEKIDIIQASQFTALNWLLLSAVDIRLRGSQRRLFVGSR